ncbi:MAG: dienelactone hydrolase family protein [Thermomicrobiales bacterium]|nr:dienelactone hydrolase family protein [Thermomicrobiales bacterium]
MKTLNQFETYLVHEFVEDYADGLMSRRDMVRRVVHITGGVAAAATTLTQLGVQPALAQSGTPPVATPSGPRSPDSVPADDPRISGSEVTYPGLDGAIVMAYQAMPAGFATPAAVDEPGLPVVLVCHENRGLTEHIRDVARRWAVQGYLACAPDLLSREGGTANIADPAEIPALLTGSADIQRHVDDFRAAVAFYATQPAADAARLGMNGFCFGGGVTWRCATQMPELRGAAPFYGPPPPLDAVPDIKAAVFGVYSSDPGDFANKGQEALAAALTAAGVTFKFEIYPDTQHAFHNDTGPRYNAAQARQAWHDAVGWFETYVKGG